jgi:protoheme IX farnesyltransferase
MGGAAGAVGPLIGWAALTGDIGWPAWALFAVIFLWTPPHFWALALKYKKDYAAAKIPMWPVVKGDESTRRHILFYTLTLFPPIAALYAFGAAGLVYLVVSLAATLYFAWKALVLFTDHDNKRAMPLFHYSCLYLFVIFGGLTLDKLLSFV